MLTEKKKIPIASMESLFSMEFFKEPSRLITGPEGHLTPGGPHYKWCLELERRTPGSLRGTELRPYPEGHLWHGRSWESFYK
jgi:hypothetical protein